MNIKAFLQKYKHAWILMYGIIYIKWFSYLETTVKKGYHIIHVGLDDKIPFIEYFIVPYMLWFLYITVTLAYFFFTNVKDYYKMCFFLFSGMTVFLIVSTIFPNGHHLRPEVFARDNIFVHAVQFLYRIDTPTNICPSIHVYNSIGALIAILKSERLRMNKKITIPATILTVLICCATVFLKQHSFVDVITATIMAGVFYQIVYKADYSLQERNNRNLIEQFFNS